MDWLDKHYSKILHFVHGQSTVSNLILSLEYVLAYFRRNMEVGVVYIVFAKSFDMAYLCILISKLKDYGVPSTLLFGYSATYRINFVLLKSVLNVHKVFTNL